MMERPEGTVKQTLAVKETERLDTDGSMKRVKCLTKRSRQTS